MGFIDESAGRGYISSAGHGVNHFCSKLHTAMNRVQNTEKHQNILFQTDLSIRYEIRLYFKTVSNLYFCFFSLILHFIFSGSSSTLEAFLKFFHPCPIPFISSGIFFPKKKNNNKQNKYDLSSSKISHLFKFKLTVKDII